MVTPTCMISGSSCTWSLQLYVLFGFALSDGSMLIPAPQSSFHGGPRFVDAFDTAGGIVAQLMIE